MYMYIYIYIYTIHIHIQIYIYVYVYVYVYVLRECLSTGYGLRFSTELYGSKREKMVFPQIPKGILFRS